MREIKFRGKQVDNGEWVYGYYAKDIDYLIDGKQSLDCIISTKEDNSEGMWSEVIPETIGQFTGLKDKDGREIYEGDIVEITSPKVKGAQDAKSERGEIVFEEKRGRFVWKDSEGVLWGLGTNDKANEVIGNIYETELQAEGKPCAG